MKTPISLLHNFISDCKLWYNGSPSEITMPSNLYEAFVLDLQKNKSTSKESNGLLSSNEFTVNFNYATVIIKREDNQKPNANKEASKTVPQLFDRINELEKENYSLKEELQIMNARKSIIETTELHRQACLRAQSVRMCGEVFECDLCKALIEVGSIHHCNGNTVERYK